LNSENIYIPVTGKTYSLFGNNSSASDYYRTIHDIALLLLNDDNDIIKHINNIRHHSKPQIINKLFRKNYYKLPFSTQINSEIEELKEFTFPIKEHLQTLPYYKMFDSVMSASEYQYHLYMIEIELTNMMNKGFFLSSENKIALLPHCLRESIELCKAKSDGIDYKCNNCKKTCYIKKISDILNGKNITPYIWLEADLKKLISYNKASTGILGIACIPELVNGIRRCFKHGIPAIGIPLNANRCRRWMGDFYPNSADLEQLEKLLS
jgi:hypothetical protein